MKIFIFLQKGRPIPIFESGANGKTRLNCKLAPDSFSGILPTFLKKRKYFHYSFKHIWSLVSHTLCFFLCRFVKTLISTPSISIIFLLQYIICTNTMKILLTNFSIWRETLIKNLFFLLKQISLFDIRLLVRLLMTRR